MLTKGTAINHWFAGPGTVIKLWNRDCVLVQWKCGRGIAYIRDCKVKK